MIEAIFKRVTVPEIPTFFATSLSNYVFSDPLSNEVYISTFTVEPYNLISTNPKYVPFE